MGNGVGVPTDCSSRCHFAVAVRGDFCESSTFLLEKERCSGSYRLAVGFLVTRMSQFLRDQASDSDEVVTPLMLDGTYLSRNVPSGGVTKIPNSPGLCVYDLLHS